jgi:hypothetical protein
MAGLDRIGTVPIEVLYSTIGWFDMNDISYFDNIVTFSNPKPLFEEVNTEIEMKRTADLKTAINSVYGLMSDKFCNKLQDPKSKEE